MSRILLAGKNKTLLPSLKKALEESDQDVRVADSVDLAIDEVSRHISKRKNICYGPTPKHNLIM